ncbi:pantoate--beta-alanine ligase [Streptomyces albidoflavus]
MRIVRTVAELRALHPRTSGDERTVGLVPTMGAFHEGHASLMRRARQVCDVVVVSLFVNPAQFPDSRALDAYPRDEERDARVAEQQGVDLLFAPDVLEMYPPGFASSVHVEGPLAHTLTSTGLSEDGQLSGMCTVIIKLLNIAEPDVVFFGEKDLPHWIAVERMAADLHVSARIDVLPTVREADGLAMSSRNVHLGACRERAACVPRAIRAVLEAVAQGERDPARARALAVAELRAGGAEPDYVEILHSGTLSPVVDLAEPAVVALSASLGGVHLVDIARIHAPHP